MDITEIKIRKLCSGRMRAVVSVTFDNELVIHDMKVIALNDRFFIAMPSRTDEAGRFRDVAHPISSSFRIRLERAVLNAYEEAFRSSGKTPETNCEEAQ